ncbi:MAG: FG-GAP-like repeat-containing protein [bacterium]
MKRYLLSFFLGFNLLLFADLNAQTIVPQVNAFDSASPQVGFPFSDGFENGLGNWIVSGSDWDTTSATSRTGRYSITESRIGYYPANIIATITLAAPLNLSSAISPVVRFWHKYSLGSNDNYYVEVSTNGGTSWTALRSFYSYSSGAIQNTWTLEQYDLKNYRGASVKVRFRLESDGTNQSDGWNIDDVSITELEPSGSIPFSDGFENGLSKWIISGSDWDTTSVTSRAGNSSITESRTGYYPANGNATITLATSLNLSSAIAPVLRFWHKYSLGSNDNYFVEVSTNGGSSWTTLKSFYPYSSGAIQSTWTLEQYDLKNYRGTTVKVRFSLESDGTNQSDGWNIDDVSITELEASASLPFSDGFENGLSNWFVSGSDWDTTTATSRAGRSSITESRLGYYPANGNAAITLAVPLNLSSAISPVLRFWHKYSLGSNDNYYVEVSTNGGTSWTALKSFYPYSSGAIQIMWTLEQYDLKNYRGSAVKIRFRLESDGTNQSDGWNIDDVSITELETSASLPFSDGFDNGLSKWLFSGSDWDTISTTSRTGRYSINDSRIGYYPANGNATITLATPLNLSASISPVLRFWHKAMINKYDYAYVELSTDGGSVWIKLGQYGYDFYQSTWKMEQYDLQNYRGPTVKIRFRLYVDGNTSVADGWYIDDVEVKENLATPTLSLPFKDGFENGLTNWIVSGSDWDTTSSTSRTGRSSLTDSRIGSYPMNGNATVTLATPLNLSSAVSPLLSFWHKAMINDYDYMYVEISTDGGSVWTKLGQYGYDFYQSTWTMEQFDLQNYRGSTVKIRFRLYADENTSVADGWYIDDVEVKERTTAPMVSLPFIDGFENGLSNWIISGSDWDTTSQNYRTGQYAITESRLGNYPDYSNASITLAGSLNLTSALSPVIRFWHKYATATYENSYVEVSTNNGSNWTTIKTISYGTQSTWKMEEISLNSYRGGTIKVRFRFKSDDSNNNDGWYIDDVLIADSPLIKVLSPNGGEMIQPGTTCKISWIAVGLSGSRLEYSLDDTSNWVFISNIAATTDSYNWLVPGVSSSRCRIRVSDVNNSLINDISDSMFIIGATGSMLPSVTTVTATSITSSTASLNGTINPNGSTTTAYFEWGTSSALASYSTTQSQSIGSGTSAITFSASLSSLTLSTNYYFRAVGQNSAGTQKGSIISFVTGGAVGIPTITSFSPTSGPIGTAVTITGTNFNPTASNNIVYFGAVKATVTLATSTSLTVTTPTGATYAPITVTDTTTHLMAYSASPFNVTFTGGGSVTASSFAVKVDFATGTNPCGLAIGDVDGDGKTDLVICNNTSNTISVYRNTAITGTLEASSFAAGVTFATAASPVSVALADFNRDGRLDILVANYEASSVSILQNSSTIGNISFRSKVDFNVVSQPWGLAVGDIDKDGKPDFAVTNYLSSIVSVFKNIENGQNLSNISFATKVDLTTAGSQPFGVALADIDSDSKVDLIVSNYVSQKVSVFKNNSTIGDISAGSFQTRVDFSTGTNLRDVVISDIDGDGKLDLVLGNDGGNVVSIMRNTSSVGSITASSFSPKVDYVVGNWPEHLVIADIDGDGKSDIITGNNGSGTLSMLKNKSTIGNIDATSFSSKIDFTVGSLPVNLSVGVADFDMDQKPDLAVLNEYSNTISIFRNTIGTPKIMGEYQPDSNTVLLLHMNETSGTKLTDESGKSNHGTATESLKPESGKFGNGWGVTNKNQQIIVQHHPTLNAGNEPMTIEMWVKARMSPTYGKRLASKFHTGPPYRGWILALTPNNYRFGGMTNTGQTESDVTNVSGPTSLADGKWHHVALEISLTEMRVYVDGVLEGTASITNVNSTDNAGIIYLNETGGEDWSGVFDEFRISNVARSPQEFNLQLPPKSLLASSASLAVNLSWQNGGGAVPFMRYKIYSGNDSLNVWLIDSTTNTNFTNSGLAQGTRYFYRVSAVDSTGFEGVKSYAVSAIPQTGVSAPTATTSAASAIASMSATLNGSVNPNGSSTTAYFEWSTNSSFSPLNTTSSQNIGSSTSATNISASLTSLTPGTTYYYRVFAQNTGGTVRGTTQNFTTLIQAPDVVTLSSPTNGASSQPVTVTLNWSSSARAASYRIQVSTSQLFSSLLLDDSTITTISRQLSGLSGSITYYWRVSAKNAGGTTAWSSTWSFTTVAGLPSAPTLAAPADNATGLAINPTLSWNSVIGATSYRLQISTLSNFSSLVLNQSGITGLSFQATGLSNSTTYYWRVSATNTGGEGSFSSTSSFTTIMSLPSAPTLSSPANNATNQASSVLLGWSSISGGTFYHLQVSTNQTFSSLSIEDSLLTTNSKQLSNLATNSTYYWRVRAKNAAGYGSWSSVYSFSTIASKTVTSPGTIFPSNPTSSTDYRLVSFPGTTSLMTSQVFSGSQNTDWRIYRDNGSAVPNHLSELSASSSLNIGEGYWLLSKGTLNFSRSLTMPQLSSDGTYSINLRSGWNIIGNPFDVAVPWDLIRSVNGFSSNRIISSYEGAAGFQSAVTLEPFKGYYFNSASTSLKIPYPFPAMNVMPLEQAQIDWKIQLVLETDINKDAENYLGIAPAAKLDLDEFDQPKPPMMFDQGFLYFSRPEWDKRYGYFNTDYRPSVGDGQVWEFVVSNPRRSTFTLRFPDVDNVPLMYDVILICQQNATPRNLRQKKFAEYQMVGEKMQFKLIVGKQTYADEQVKLLLPREFVLAQNYPNPFNPSTQISYWVPKESAIRIEVWSILGQHITTLVDRVHPPGEHSVIWYALDQSGRSVSSGVYFYKLVVNNQVVATMKMMYLR